LFSSRFSFRHETYIPAKPHKKKKNARIPGAHVDSRWPIDFETPACERSRRIVTLRVTPEVPRDSGVGNTFSGPTKSRPLLRLSNAAEFDRVFKNCRRSADSFFTVLYRTNDLDYPRLGLAIAKKNIPLSVGRNRLKRIIRESFRNAEQKLNGLDIVIMARRKAGATPNAELFQSLEHHWKSLNRRAGN
jgi:ribonuclease P protein component